MIGRQTTGRAVTIGRRTMDRLADIDRFVGKLQSHGAKQSPPRLAPQELVVLVENATTGDRRRFDVLGIDEMVVSPSDNEGLFLSGRIAFKGVEPTVSHIGRFVVLKAPLVKDAIGKAYVAGTFPALVEMASETHAYADVNVGSSDYLLSNSNGAAQMLYVEPVDERADPGVARCIVRVGGGSGGGAQFALITGHAGEEPPYRYSADAAVMDADGEWSTASGGASYVNVFNLEEQGDGGQWVNPLLTGDAVTVLPAPGGADAWVCSRSHYRGAF